MQNQWVATAFTSSERLAFLFRGVIVSYFLGDGPTNSGPLALSPLSSLLAHAAALFAEHALDRPGSDLRQAEFSAFPPVHRIASQTKFLREGFLREFEEEPDVPELPTLQCREVT
jgi:hypothetical protein